jgi:hypothetical protein
MITYDASDILKMLEDKIPLRSPDLRWSEKEVWFYAGQRAVINLIRFMIEQDEEEIPTILKGE